MGKLVVTSIKVDDELWKEARIEAIRRGISVAELLNAALRRELQVRQKG